MVAQREPSLDYNTHNCGEVDIETVATPKGSTLFDGTNRKNPHSRRLPMFPLVVQAADPRGGDGRSSSPVEYRQQ